MLEGYQPDLGHCPPYVLQGYVAPSGLACEKREDSAASGLAAWAMLDRPFGARMEKFLPVGICRAQEQIFLRLTGNSSMPASYMAPHVLAYRREKVAG